ncbi:hypothetical protein EHQ42_13970 [Leptospira levettii]|uniref:hypothetical protein n=1 Tax=Leptospira levettii TaxID=2023178 RepID=UPI0010830579|nr:hypothetical protein [Leptospira levettii]TGL14190.1 hypothetical protein EHQ42_13970 [Leptospira levettii]
MKYIFVFLFLIVIGCNTQQKTNHKQNQNGYDTIQLSESDLYKGPDLLSPPDSPGFQYSSYLPISFDGFLERGYSEENSKGMKIFNSRNKIILKLMAYPTKDLNSDEMGRRDTFALFYPNMKSIIHIYDSKLKLKYKEQNFLIIFQSQLVPYLRSEVKLGDLVGLFVIHTTYDEFTNTHVILVNEFHKY